MLMAALFNLSRDCFHAEIAKTSSTQDSSLQICLVVPTFKIQDCFFRAKKVALRRLLPPCLTVNRITSNTDEPAILHRVGEHVDPLSFDR